MWVSIAGSASAARHSRLAHVPAPLLDALVPGHAAHAASAVEQQHAVLHKGCVAAGVRKLRHDGVGQRGGERERRRPQHVAGEGVVQRGASRARPGQVESDCAEAV